MGGHTMLGSKGCMSFFFLQMRIFCSTDPAQKPPAQPSGFVLGWSRCGAATSLLTVTAGGFNDSLFLQS
jgi:hypothetical protein